MKTIHAAVLILLLFLQPRASAGDGPPADTGPRMLVRCDDIGMCQAVNAAFRRVAETGIPVSASVMFACPWYRDAAEILKAHPHVSVGVHLVLNAEWRNYRWGPVAGAAAVPSLVDADGLFFPSRAALFANNPKTAEVERELRAQIERAKGTGLRIDYLDTHMGAAVQTPELRALVERLAEEYGVGIAQYFDEAYSSNTYGADFPAKGDSLVARLAALDPARVNLQVFHIGLDTPELAAMEDMNSFGLKEMSRHRQAELDALLSERFLKEARSGNVRMVTYGDLLRATGVAGMRRPAEFR